jgi:hypothetical protein
MLVGQYDPVESERPHSEDLAADFGDRLEVHNAEANDAGTGDRFRRGRGVANPVLEATEERGPLRADLGATELEDATAPVASAAERDSPELAGLEGGSRLGTERV